MQQTKNNQKKQRTNNQNKPKQKTTIANKIKQIKQKNEIIKATLLQETNKNQQFNNS